VHRLPLLLDCDPGHDDAVAIVVAAHFGELLAITTVSGNAPLARTTENALLVTQLFGIDVPVHAGADRPLVGEAKHAESIHGITGLDGPERPPLTRAAADGHAVDALIELTRQHDDVWLVATGPFTNVAQALTRDPGLARRVRGIAVMGGSTSFGNWSPVAEFNVVGDPEAAAVVLACGAEIRMIGLNASHQVLVDAARTERLRVGGTPQATFIAGLYDFFRATYRRVYAMDAAPMHDPCAVLAALQPELFEMHARHVEVETAGRFTRGMTVVDERGPGIGAPPNVRVVYGVDASGVLDRIEEAVLAAGPAS
jgi:inosine-uridine nucleoside N-ribohydrolase